MSKRTLLILGTTFLALLAATTYDRWSAYLPLSWTSRNSETQPAELVTLTSLIEDQVERFTIKHGATEDIFQRGTNGWQVNGYAVAASQAERFFSNLKALKLVEIAAKNPSSHQSLEVTEGLGYLLTITSPDGKNNRTFIAGKRGTDYITFFLRAKESSSVYLVRGSLLDQLQQTVSAWRDRVLVNLETGGIGRIQATGPAANFIASHNAEGEWNLNRGGKNTTLDETQTNKLLGSLHPLEGYDFLDDEKVKAFQRAKGKTTVHVSDGEGKVIAEIALLERDGVWQAQLAGRDTYYQVAAYQVGNLLLLEE